jgi:protein-tyrosine phosphatase
LFGLNPLSRRVLFVCLGNICRSPTAEGVLRQVTQDDFERFDLILAMDRENLRELSAMKPDNSRAALKLFLEYAPELNLRDVPDPYYLDASAFEAVLDLTTAASRGLLATLEERQA